MEWLALMQHHGGPTRLLDWTYSFWNAVLFAIEEARVGTGDSCAVWALEIPWWRDRVAQEVPKFYGMYIRGATANEEMKYILGEKNPKPGIWPLNAYRLNERVISQRGLFVAPLDIKKSFIDNLHASFEGEDLTCPRITKLVIPCRKDIIEECVQYLYAHNITFAALFPNLDGFARSLGDLVLTPERFHGVGDEAWP